jgi:hypothetical protein
MGQTPGDETKNEPSLELPSLSLPGFGRKKKSKRQEEQPSEEPASTPEAVAPVAPEPAPAPEEPASRPEAVTPAAPEPAPTPEEPAERAPRAQRAPRPVRSAPVVPGRVAAALTGLVVGALGGVATYGAMEGCEAVRGVSTCGGAPGFFILVAILALMVLLGAGLLKVFRVEAPGSTSFLAVGVVTVVAMLVLLDVIFSATMFVVIPALSAVAFLLGHWVTTRFDEHPTDVRR